MYPIQSPKAISSKRCWGQTKPVFLDGSNEAIHPIIYFPEMGRLVITDRDRLLTKPAAQLTEICYRHMIERPKQVFIKRRWPFVNTNFDAVQKKPILTIQVLLLNTMKQGWIILFKNKHSFARERGARILKPMP